MTRWPTLQACAGATAPDRASARAALGLSPGDGPVLLADGSCRRQDDQKLVLWAGCILSMLKPQLKVIVPGDGPVRGTLGSWIAQTGYGPIAVFTDARFERSVLLAAADVLVHAAAGESDGSSVRLAMAAGVPVVSVASPAASPLIAHERTGLVCRAGPRDLAMQIRRVLIDASLRHKLTDAAGAEAANFAHA